MCALGLLQYLYQVSCGCFQSFLSVFELSCLLFVLVVGCLCGVVGSYYLQLGRCLYLWQSIGKSCIGISYHSMLCRMHLRVGLVRCLFVGGVVCCYVGLYLCVDLCVCRRCRCKHMLGVLGLVYLGKVWIILFA